MKIAVSGKGGVGKTTVSALLAAAWALRGRGVIAVDADPDANLASALGVPADEQITPLCEMEEMIAERTGAKDQYGGYFKLNPRVDDLPEKYARRIGEHIHLLVLGGVSKGGGGCICPATTVLKALLVYLVLGRDEAIVMDMEAGIEHLGRATAQSMDALLLVVDDGPWSVQTALRIKKLAGDLGLKNLFAVANRMGDGTGNPADPATLAAIAGRLDGIPLIGQLPCDRRLAAGVLTAADGQVRPSQATLAHLPAIQAVLDQLDRRVGA
ncbi:MAG: AAA family ATPase [Planctomycetes bacterium]|nr:AAA family ATPase [Planctomycetota bacterium]